MSQWDEHESWGGERSSGYRKVFKDVKPKSVVQSYALMRRLDKKQGKKLDKIKAARKEVVVKKNPPMSERRINDTTFLSVKGKVIGRNKGGPKSSPKGSQQDVKEVKRAQEKTSVVDSSRASIVESEEKKEKKVKKEKKNKKDRKDDDK